jgi:hypothetical protein
MMRPVFLAAVDPFIGIPEAAQEREVLVVPNPASNCFRLSGTLDMPVRMQVMDGLGRIVLDRTVNGMEEVDSSSLRNGLYMVRIAKADGSGLRAGRLIIQH